MFHLTMGGNWETSLLESSPFNSLVGGKSEASALELSCGEINCQCSQQLEQPVGEMGLRG